MCYIFYIKFKKVDSFYVTIYNKVVIITTLKCLQFP